LGGKKDRRQKRARVSEGGRERRKNLEQEMRGEAGESGCV